MDAIDRNWVARNSPVAGMYHIRKESALIKRTPSYYEAER